MARFTARIGLFILIFLATIQFFKYCIGNKHWGNDELRQKINLFERKHSDYNTIFIGNSKTYRGFIPSQFDKIVNTKSQNKSTSFNMGVPGMYFFESYELAKYLIKKYPGKAIIFQHQLPTEIAPNNLYSNKNTYFMNPYILKNAIQYYGTSNFKQLKYHTIALIRNAFLFKSIKTYLEKKPLFTSRGLWRKQKEQHGYVTLQQEYSITKKKNLKKRRDRLVRASKKTDIINDIKKDKFSPINESVMIKLYEDLNSQAIDKKSEIVILIDPDHQNFLDHEFKGGIIDMPKKDKFKKYYLIKNRYDRGHLNEQGTKIYTKKAAELYLGS